MSKDYTVWVGGVEVNDYYLSKKEAVKLSEIYEDRGYDDVVVEKIKKGRSKKCIKQSR